MEQPLNLVSNTTLRKNVADYTLIVIGAFLQALSYSLFLAPYKIVPGVWYIDCFAPRDAGAFLLYARRIADGSDCSLF